ncbi:hypothetical protein Ndes2526B_g02663 [Nannochloris sp. 'desiccata']
MRTPAAACPRRCTDEKIRLYLTHLLVKSEAQQKKASVLLGPRDAISTLHKMCGLPSPTTDEIVTQILEGAKRILARPIKKRAPLTTVHLQQLASRFRGAAANVQDHMLVTAMSVGFFGFFRYSDLAAITAQHVRFARGHMRIFLPGSKTDQLRHGSSVTIKACPGKAYCPMALMLHLYARARLAGTTHPVFMQFESNRQTTRPMTYTYCHKSFQRLFRAIGLNSDYGTHSLRIGGATLACTSQIPESEWMAHGRWKSTTAARGYVQPTQ